MTDLRAAFEAWAEPNWYLDRDPLFPDKYKDSGTQCAWLGWQAAQPEAEPVALKDALTWYADEARAIAKNSLAKNDQALLASVTVLALDAGKRADRAMGEKT